MAYLTASTPRYSCSDILGFPFFEQKKLKSRVKYTHTHTEAQKESENENIYMNLPPASTLSRQLQ